MSCDGHVYRCAGIGWGPMPYTSPSHVSHHALHTVEPVEPGSFSCLLAAFFACMGSLGALACAMLLKTGLVQVWVHVHVLLQDSGAQSPHRLVPVLLTVVDE